MATPVPTRSPKNPSSMPNEIQFGLCAAAIAGADDVPPKFAINPTEAVKQSNLNNLQSKSHTMYITASIIRTRTTNCGASVHWLRSEYDIVMQRLK